MINGIKYTLKNVGWLLLTGILILFGCGSGHTGESTAKSEAKVYKKPASETGLGDLSLQGENLSVVQFLNGDKIFEAKSKADWLNAGRNKQPAFCYGTGENQYGKKDVLYNYYALADPRGLVAENKLLTKIEMEEWLKKWNHEQIGFFSELSSEERNFSGTFFDLEIVNWWLLSETVESEENGTQAYVLGWAKDGKHASIQLASTANGFYIRCKK